MTNLFFDNLGESSWDNIPWHDLNVHLFKIQTKIYNATCKKQIVTRKKMQLMLLEGYSTRLIALYRVTQYPFIKKKFKTQTFLLSM